MDRSCHRLTLSALVVSTDKGPIVYKTTEYKESNEVYKERSPRRSVRRQILRLRDAGTEPPSSATLTP